ncbi:MAG: hypothetical protein ACLFOY_01040 [Desulfatibacillaceae bacterium]
MPETMDRDKLMKVGPYVGIVGWFFLLHVAVAMMKPGAGRFFVAGLPAGAWGCLAGVLVYVAALLTVIPEDMGKLAWKWFTPYVIGTAATAVSVFATGTAM